MDEIFKALADPIRRDILRRAHEGRLSVSALAREHPISVTAMQKHVAVLERAELVSKHRVGRESIVRTETDALVRARAALEGRDYVVPDDVKAIAVAVLRHRLTLSPAAEIEGRLIEQLVTELIESTEAPR